MLATALHEYIKVDVLDDGLISCKQIVPFEVTDGRLHQQATTDKGHKSRSEDETLFSTIFAERKAGSYTYEDNRGNYETT